MRTKQIAAIVTIVAMVTATGSAWAFHGGFFHRDGDLDKYPGKRLLMGHVGRLLVLKSQLNVTEDQKKKIGEILKGHTDEIVPVAKTLLDNRKHLREAVLKEPADEKAIRAAAEDLTKSVADASILAAKLIAEARPVLTTRQWEVLHEAGDGFHKATIDWLDQLREN